ncbi:thiamine transport system ATP-binding protein [Bisgaardia hudsonensis]|uniref:Thiamine transport system ATP-binding protein n=1 Tax=Bisgaardia hudsonensis TaxID=109472 RepID=A0A4R2N2I4_9PAST|nr:thiamine ABC transporter ATP-binding protein [Bisgaardia hudsonensis]QLB12562.1 thiamine ABC transporter, ATP-binding protein [Bisgaardia hudsonensis]TCP14104.1 thiamine transport system ATP-binding protein [Bisgaardia hudsonensis]
MIKLNTFFDYPEMPMYFDLHIKPQQKVAIIGESGAGKSTLLNLIAGFEKADRGEIWLNGENHSYSFPAERPVSILFQDNNLFTHLTVQQNIALGIKPNLKLSSIELERMNEVASAVGLQALLHRLPNELSGGQKQRVALARCLLRDKPILLLDEPFSALDPQLRLEMLNLIEQLSNDKKLTLVIVTHQPDELNGKIDRILKINAGRVSDF